jgi:glycine/D-amino acid oxidase-like deaminating enzyme
MDVKMQEELIMDLNTGKLYWNGTLEENMEFPPLEEDITCDVVIVGSGSSGAHCAYFMAETGLKVVLVDKRDISGGSTSANTGLLQFSNDKSLTSLINTFGAEAAVRHVNLCAQALQTLGNKIVPSLDEDPDFSFRKSLYFASDNKDVPMLQEEYQQLIKYGFPATYLTENEINKSFPFSKPAALITDGDAEINPYKNAHYLIKYAQDKGVRIFSNTRINGKILKEDKTILYTDQGFSISADKVIFATGYEAQEEVSDSNAQVVSSYAIATNPIYDDIGWKEDMMIWETARPYIYARRTADRRIIIGGLDEYTTYRNKRDSMIIHKRDKLIEELIKLFPSLQSNVEAEFYWGAFFGESKDGLPTIGMYENYPNCYFLLGYGGNGTVYSIILSQIIRDLITKGSHPDIELYRSGGKARKESIAAI